MANIIKTHHNKNSAMFRRQGDISPIYNRSIFSVQRLPTSPSSKPVDPMMFPSGLPLLSPKYTLQSSFISTVNANPTTMSTRGAPASTRSSSVHEADSDVGNLDLLADLNLPLSAADVFSFVEAMGPLDGHHSHDALLQSSFPSSGCSSLPPFNNEESISGASETSHLSSGLELSLHVDSCLEDLESGCSEKIGHEPSDAKSSPKENGPQESSLVRCISSKRKLRTKIRNSPSSPEERKPMPVRSVEQPHPITVTPAFVVAEPENETESLDNSDFQSQMTDESFQTVISRREKQRNKFSKLTEESRLSHTNEPNRKANSSLKGSRASRQRKNTTAHPPGGQKRGTSPSPSEPSPPNVLCNSSPSPKPGTTATPGISAAAARAQMICPWKHLAPTTGLRTPVTQPTPKSTTTSVVHPTPVDPSIKFMRHLWQSFQAEYNSLQSSEPNMVDVF